MHQCSVYGDVSNFIKRNWKTDKPLSTYAASKKSNVLAHSYSNIFKIPTTGLRFFTVYGPFGRPEMFHLNHQVFLIIKLIYLIKEII